MDPIVEAPREGIAPRQEAPSDCTPRQLAEERYVRALAGMVEHAAENRDFALLADVLASALAGLAFRCGPAATGDILARLGGHLLNAAERRRAAEEAEQARKDGAAFQ